LAQKSQKGVYVDDNIAAIGRSRKIANYLFRNSFFSRRFFKKIILANIGYTVRNILKVKLVWRFTKKSYEFFPSPFNICNGRHIVGLAAKLGVKVSEIYEVKFLAKPVKGQEDFQRATGISITGHLLTLRR
jgi:hypothetical protein